MPVVSGNGVLVRAATHSGPVMLESLSVIVPASVCMLAPGIAGVMSRGVVAPSGATVVVPVVVPPVIVPVVVPGIVPVVVLPTPVGIVRVVVPVPVVAVPSVVPPVAVGVVPTAAVPAERLIAAPHVGCAAVFVTTTSVMIRVWSAGTVKAVTVVVPAGTMRVISTRFSTTGAVVVAGDALTLDTLAPVLDVVALPMVVVVVPSEPTVVVCVS